MLKHIEVSILLDIYGKLLTEKQANILDMYYNQDLSLSEIAEVVEKFREYKKTLKEKEEAESLMKDPEMKELAEMELYEAKEKLPKLEEELKILYFEIHRFLQVTNKIRIDNCKSKIFKKLSTMYLY